MKYLITFYSHYEAVRARASLTKRGLKVSLVSVPRVLSSSCGTAALAEAEYNEIKDIDAEAFYFVLEDGSYRRVENG